MFVLGALGADRQGTRGGCPREQMRLVIAMEPWGAGVPALPCPALCHWAPGLADRPLLRPQVPAGLLLSRAVRVLHHQGVREEL